MSTTQEKLLNELVDIVVKENASDLHLSENRPPVIRVSNFLIPLVKMPVLSRENMEGLLLLLLSPLNRKEFDDNKETNFAYNHANLKRFRCNAFLSLGKTSVAMRLVPSKIKSFEDPIEYIFESKRAIINQREVKLDTPDFHTALQGIFRQDADILMIGEMRDPETISTAVTAAETGHLVLSTLHTNNAAQPVTR